jgi:choline transport protein
VVHIGGLIAILLVLGIMAPKHDASYVFVETSNASGWSNDGVSWLVGLVSAVYPFLGYDAAVHLSEEMDNPSRNVPLAMVGSVFVNGILGLGYCLMLLFSLGDLDDLLTSATGFPFIQLYLNVTKSTAGATIMTLIVCLIAVAANSAGLTSTSRTAWAFARDSALPFSEYFSQIDEKLKVPKRVVVLTTILQMLLGFLYLGSTTAFNAVLSMAILGVYASYLVPVVYMLLYGRRNNKHVFGWLKLGNTGGAVLNVISILWLLVAMLFSMFPSYQPVTPENMNYSIAVMGGWLVLGMAYFVIWGRKTYTGPLLGANILVGKET